MSKIRADSTAPAAKRSVPIAPSHALDAVDLHILELLRQRGRMTNVQIASRVGVSPPPALRRTRTLEEAGYIQGYHARLNAKALGYPVTAFLFVGLKWQRASEIAAFERKLRSWPLVREYHALTGQTDYLLKCVARESGDIHRLVSDGLLKTDNVVSVRTAFCMGVTKDEPGPPLSLPTLPAAKPPTRSLRLPPLR